MKTIVTHTSPDWDAITSVWIIKRFLPGWDEAEVEFVPAGSRHLSAVSDGSLVKDPVEHVESGEMIHVDTGLGPLDHHQTSDDRVSGASVSFEYVKNQNHDFKNPSSERVEDKILAIERIVKVVVSIDHFKEVFWENPTADYHEISLLGVLEGLKLQKPDSDLEYIDFGMECLDALLHEFENRIWAEKEIEKGHKFNTHFGKGIGFETINDDVLKLSQKMGYVIVVRKDPRKGYVRIKGRPSEGNSEKEVDLTFVYDKLKKMDPKATWFLHVSKKMLLNGTPKNPSMVPTKLSLDDIISVLKSD